MHKIVSSRRIHVNPIGYWTQYICPQTLGALAIRPAMHVVLIIARCVISARVNIYCCIMCCIFNDCKFHKILLILKWFFSKEHIAFYVPISKQSRDQRITKPMRKILHQRVMLLRWSKTYNWKTGSFYRAIYVIFFMAIINITIVKYALP